jgi:adenine-specific DNA-methyltransferase
LTTTGAIAQAEAQVAARAAFCTPDVLARFLVGWAVRTPKDAIIDLCTGDGVFLEAAADRLLFLGADGSAIQSMIGVEIDRVAAKNAYSRLQRRFDVSPTIIQRGFFATLPSLQEEYFDAVVGNPPFLRYRHFFENERELAWDFMDQQGFGASRLMNSWVPFLVAACHLLRKGGRLAMIVPAELFQVSYAGKVRDYLLNRFGFVFVVTFNRLVFPNVEQEIVLLMGTKGEGAGLRLIEIEDERELSKIPQLNTPQMPVKNSKEKWTQYFLSDVQRTVLRKVLANAAIRKLGDFCSIDVGVVTGANDFFVIPRNIAIKLKAKRHMFPIVTRTKHLSGLVFRDRDWRNLESNNIPSYLLSVNPAFSLSKHLEDYIQSGRQKRYHRGFKCKNRIPWFNVPSTWRPDAFLFRQIGSYPRMILNLSKATCTDTLHRVKFNKRSYRKKIGTCFHNSLTMAFAEITGRSYGGGVLELMPSEAEGLPIPVLPDIPNHLSHEIDGLFKEGLRAEAIQAVDHCVLVERMGITRQELTIIRSVWSDLSERRKSRGMVTGVSA